MKRKIFDVKILGLILVVGVSIFFSIVILQEDIKVENSDNDGFAKAVIVDQLHDDMPNSYFQQTAKEYLEAAGYHVDIFTTKYVTVDFYKNLPKMNYKIVVVRTHGAPDHTDSNSVVLFTGEKYTEDKYISEQLFGHVKRVTPLLEIAFKVEDDDLSKWVVVNDTYSYLRIPANPIDKTKNEFFAISSKLVEESMVGKFPGTIFLLGGCNTLENPSMAKSLIERGASIVVGWEDAVGSALNDHTLLTLLKKTLINDMKMEDAVDYVMEREFKGTPDVVLKYYSQSSA